MSMRTLVISVNVTTDAPTEEVVQAIKRDIACMDEIGWLGESPFTVRCEQVEVIVEEEA